MNNSQVLLLNASDEYSKLGDSDILNQADNYGNKTGWCGRCI